MLLSLVESLDISPKIYSNFLEIHQPTVSNHPKAHSSPDPRNQRSIRLLVWDISNSKSNRHRMRNTWGWIIHYPTPRLQGTTRPSRSDLIHINYSIFASTLVHSGQRLPSTQSSIWTHRRTMAEEYMKAIGKFWLNPNSIHLLHCDSSNTLE